TKLLQEILAPEDFYKLPHGNSGRRTMKGNEHMKTITNIIYPAFALFAFACLALAPRARATCQDACLTNNTTVQGDDALINLTTGVENTAVGFIALYSNTTGSFNLATGDLALAANTTGDQNTATGSAALYSNTTGFFNTAVGSETLQSNT